MAARVTTETAFVERLVDDLDSVQFEFSQLTGQFSRGQPTRDVHFGERVRRAERGHGEGLSRRRRSAVAITPTTLPLGNDFASFSRASERMSSPLTAIIAPS
jgi:hypothetical protein